MRLIRLEQEHPGPDQIMSMAGQETLLLHRSGGDMFVFSKTDESDAEAALLKNNREFMEFLKKLSREEPVITLSELRKELDV